MSLDRNELIKQYLRSRVQLYGATAFVPPSVATPPPQFRGEEQPIVTMPKKEIPGRKVVVAETVQVIAAHVETNKSHGSHGLSANVPVQAGAGEPWQSATDLSSLNAQICTCLKCALGNTRHKFVFGVGSPQAKLVVIGEAPGKDEDEQGEPFVGRAGQLLNKILEAIQFKREEVFICNILKCRPPGNRDPLPEEVEQCEPYLYKQLEILQPKIILALGRIAANTLLKTNLSMRDLRTSMHTYRGIPLMATYHPAALLRNPAWKKETWEDVQKLRALYDSLL